MENQELLEAIGKLMDEKIETIEKKMDEKLKPIKDQLEILTIKQEVTKNHVEELTFQVTALRHDTKKEFKKLDDEMETVITVLEGRNLMPKKIG